LSTSKVVTDRVQPRLPPVPPPLEVLDAEPLLDDAPVDDEFRLPAPPSCRPRPEPVDEPVVLPVEAVELLPAEALAEELVEEVVEAVVEELLEELDALALVADDELVLALLPAEVDEVDPVADAVVELPELAPELAVVVPEAAPVVLPLLPLVPQAAARETRPSIETRRVVFIGGSPSPGTQDVKYGE
jgi:hypothetical protein